jgi:antitoxin MazE
MEYLKVAKWGNSLAVRIPAKMAADLDLKEGDILTRDALALRRGLPKLTREEANETIRQMRKAAPKGLKPEDWKIDRSATSMRG